MNWNLKLWYRLPYLFWLSKKITELICDAQIDLWRMCWNTNLVHSMMIMNQPPPSPSLDLDSYCTFLVLIIWKFCQILLQYKKIEELTFFFLQILLLLQLVVSPLFAMSSWLIINRSCFVFPSHIVCSTSLLCIICLCFEVVDHIIIYKVLM